MSELGYLNYRRMVKSSSELVSSDRWTLHIDKWPSVIYHPTTDDFKTQVKGVDGLNQNLWSHGSLSTSIRNFQTPEQPGMIRLENKEITIHLIDYQSQEIYIMIMDWKMKCFNALTSQSYPAEALRMNLTLTRLTNTGEPLRIYKMENAMVQDPNYDEPFTGDSRELVGTDIQLTLKGCILPTTFPQLNSQE